MPVVGYLFNINLYVYVNDQHYQPGLGIEPRTYILSAAPNRPYNFINYSIGAFVKVSSAVTQQ